MTTTLDVMTFLLDRFVSGLPLSKLSDIFDRLIWCLADNGKEIEEVRQKWLFSDNKKKVEVAIYMSETFPFNHYNELDSCYRTISEKWPDLKDRCTEVLNAWKAQFPE